MTLDELLKEWEHDYEAYRASVARPVGEGKPLEKVFAVYEHGLRLIAALRYLEDAGLDDVDSCHGNHYDETCTCRPDNRREARAKVLAILQGEK